VQWGDSTRARVGDWVLAVGDPYGVGSTVTAGFISALHRNITGAGAYDRYIQTDASINMGNSGGPMFDLNGNVIGVNSALISPTGASVGIGLAIPAELAKPVIDTLRRGQQPQRGYLGVGLQPVDEDDIAAALGLPKGGGELVRSVQPGDPAAKAGLQQGDVIVAVNGQAVNPDQTVSFLIANTPVGSRVPIDIMRGGKRISIPVVVGQRPSEEELAKRLGANSDEQMDEPDAPITQGSQTLGLSLQPLTPAIARTLSMPAGVKGVVITNVDASSDASDKGLRRGDVIMSVNRQDVTTPAQVVAGVDAARRSGRTSVLLLVKRGSAPEAFVGVNLTAK
jgi:serine protease Do